MVEGLLLPVSLPETQDLYRALMHRPRSSRPPAGCLSPPHDHASDRTEHGQDKSLSWNAVRENLFTLRSDQNRNTLVVLLRTRMQPLVDLLPLTYITLTLLPFIPIYL